MKKTHTLYLAKPDVTDFSQILSEKAREKLRHRLTQIIDLPNFADGSRLYVFVGDEYTPQWAIDLGRIAPLTGPITNRSACALLVFRASDRYFISTFSHGWMLIDEHYIEGDFGLRVAINLLNDKKLKRLERANLGDAMRGVSLSPFQREFTSFGLDDALDLVRKISGTTREDVAADNVTGAKSLKISGEFEISDLPDLASDALEAFNAIDYQETSFKVIDFVSPIMDLRLIENLDRLACESIKADTGEFELGLPSTGESECVGYKFHGPGLRGYHPDLLMSNYIEALDGDLENIEPKTLRNHKIESIYENDEKNQKWSIRTSMVGSLVYEDGRYAINEGEWYQVDQQFKDGIEQNFQDLYDVWTDRPFPLRKIYDVKGNGTFEAEEDYNRSLAEHLGVCLLDQKLIHIPDIQRSDFEACDLLDIPGKRFIHVKKSSRRSSVLSHFFKQGSNSAQQFGKFPAAWTDLSRVIREEYGQDMQAELQQAIENEDLPWTVEFLIADTPRRDGTFNIPFFSKISLRDEVINLRAQGYHVTLKFIGLEA